MLPSEQPEAVGTAIIDILRIRKLRHREMKVTHSVSGRESRIPGSPAPKLYNALTGKTVLVQQLFLWEPPLLG